MTRSPRPPRRTRRQPKMRRRVDVVDGGTGGTARIDHRVGIVRRNRALPPFTAARSRKSNHPRQLIAAGLSKPRSGL